MLPRCRANESRPSRCDIFSTDRVVSVMWGLATWQGSRWSSARPEARGGRCRKVREGKETKGSESCWKSGGGRTRLYVAKCQAEDADGRIDSCVDCIYGGKATLSTLKL